MRHEGVDVGSLVYLRTTVESSLRIPTLKIREPLVSNSPKTFFFAVVCHTKRINNYSGIELLDTESGNCSITMVRTHCIKCHRFPLLTVMLSNNNLQLPSTSGYHTEHHVPNAIRTVSEPSFGCLSAGGVFAVRRRAPHYAHTFCEARRLRVAASLLACCCCCCLSHSSLALACFSGRRP